MLIFSTWTTLTTTTTTGRTAKPSPWLIRSRPGGRGSGWPGNTFRTGSDIGIGIEIGITTSREITAGRNTNSAQRREGRSLKLEEPGNPGLSHRNRDRTGNRGRIEFRNRSVREKNRKVKRSRPKFRNRSSRPKLRNTKRTRSPTTGTGNGRNLRRRTPLFLRARNRSLDRRRWSSARTSRPCWTTSTTSWI